MNNEKKLIGSFCGLKVIALGTIFYWHSMLPKTSWGDLGLHATQFFFIVSGFLVANRYWEEWKAGGCTVSQSIKYFWKKVKSIWPLHLALLFLLVAWQASSRFYSAADWIQAVVSATFMQAWTGQLFAWNGPAWFISALLFCYAVAPLLIGLMKNERYAIVILVLVLAVRYAIEWVQLTYPGKFWTINYHGYPIVRCLEFYAGSLMFPTVRNLRRCIDAKKFSRIVFTILEFLAVGVLCVIVIPNLFHQIRGSLVLWYSLFVFVFAFDRGCVSMVLGTRPFRVLATIELAFFLLHVPIREFSQPLFSWLAINVNCQFLIWLSLTLAVAFLWQSVVMRTYKLNRAVWWLLAVFLCGSVIWVLTYSAYACSFCNQIQLQFDESSKQYFNKTERIAIFYSTERKPAMWQAPVLCLSIPANGQTAFKCRLPDGLKQFRIEFQPKRGCKLGKSWPKIDKLLIGGREIHSNKLSPYYYAKSDRPSFDGKMTE